MTPSHKLPDNAQENLGNSDKVSDGPSVMGLGTTLNSCLISVLKISSLLVSGLSHALKNGGWGMKIS